MKFPGATHLLLGFSGPRQEAEEIKRQIGQYLRQGLRLEMSEAKTLITHARTQAARFLGYEVVALEADVKQDHRGQRCINGVVQLKVPRDVITEQCRPYMSKGKAVHRPEQLSDDDFSIIAQYQAEYRGFVQYYLMAFNAHRLGKVHHVMRRSLLATLANKHRTRIATVARRLATKGTDRGRTLKALILVQDRGQGKKPLVAMFGGISLAWKRDVIIDDSPKQVYNGLRSELVRRLLAQKCELCGTEEGPFEVHHIRKLAELDRPSRREKPLWVKRMASRRRKTLVTCQRCHQALHRGCAGWRKKTKHWKAG